jgi:hypothetical protein
MSEQIILPGAAAPKPPPLSVAVTEHDGQVVLHFSEPREFVGLMPNEAAAIGMQMLVAAVQADSSYGQQAIDLAMSLVDLVYELRGDLKPAGGAMKHELMERHRRILTRRVEVMLNSLRERRKVSNFQLSKELVEVAIKEILT